MDDHVERSLISEADSLDPIKLLSDSSILLSASLISIFSFLIPDRSSYLMPDLLRSNSKALIYFNIFFKIVKRDHESTHQYTLYDESERRIRNQREARSGRSVASL